MLARPQALPLAESMITFYQERVVRSISGPKFCTISEPIEVFSRCSIMKNMTRKECLMSMDILNQLDISMHDEEKTDSNHVSNVTSL